MRLATRMRLAAAGQGESFDPLSIGWHSAFYADDITGLGDNDPVATWSDSSGNGRDATQATSSKRPVYKPALATMNGQPAVQFDGVDDALMQSAFTAVASGEVVVVVRLGSTSDRGIVNGISGSNRWAIQTSSSQWSIHQGTPSGLAGGTVDTSPRFLRAEYQATDKLHVDGTEVVSAAFGAESLTGLTLGAYVGGTSGNMGGAFAFVGMIDRALTAQERSDLLVWSQSKYGTP